jgi:hypothetical protein
MNGQYGTTTSPLARIVERRPGQPATHALERLVDLGVEESDPPSTHGVLSVACQLAVGPELVTILGWIVADLGVHLSFIRAQGVAYQKMPRTLSRL